MKLGIMQPYFFPYLGYISLIKHTDMFILLDTVQYIRRGWISRNRILKPTDGWQYVTIPVAKHKHSELISNIIIDNSVEWKGRIIAQLEHYKKKAPFYDQVMDVLAEVFSKEYDDVVSVNQAALTSVCNYLNIERDFIVFSRMGLDIEPVRESDEWALNICLAQGNVDEYWNPPGGQSFISRDKFEKFGIKLVFHSINFTEYNQRRDVFEPGLSIIDVMMFNTPSKINDMLDQFELL
jgi:hypothetical protein